MKFTAKKRKLLIFAAVVAAALLCGICIFRIWYVNTKMPAPAVKTAKAGEVMLYDGAAYQVEKYDLLENEETLRETYPELYESMRIEGYTFSYLCVDLVIENQRSTTLSAGDLWLEVNARQYANGGVLRPREVSENSMELAPGESRKFMAVFRLDSGFAGDFDPAETRLLLSHYPEQFELGLE